MPAISKKNKKMMPTELEMDEVDEKPNKGQTVISGQLQKQIDKKKFKKRTQKKKKGVVFIKNLPHGFFEEQLRKYFEQFGSVTRVRLARSTRTGNSKGYAYVEFDVPEVAEIAAETMSNYLMFQKIVKATYIPPENQKYNYFKTKIRKVTDETGKEKYVSSKIKHIENKMRSYNNWNDETYGKRIKSNLKKLNKLKKKYANTDIDFDKLVVGLNNSDNLNDKTKNGDNEDSVNSSSSQEKSKKIECEQIKTETPKESSNNSSDEDSDSPQCGSILLIKKHKQKSNNITKKPKKLLKLLDSSVTLSSRSTDTSLSQASKSTTDSEDENKSVNIKNNKKEKKSRNDTELDSIIKRKPLTGGIQKSKNKVLKTKKKNNQNEMKNKLLEATFKAMMNGKSTNVHRDKKKK